MHMKEENNFFKKGPKIQDGDTYVFDAHTNHPADTIKQNVLNFYSTSAIHDAKLALWNA